MKINELLGQFHIFMSNEEESVFNTINETRPYDSFSEREQVILDSLIRKSIVKRIRHQHQYYVKKNEQL